MNMRYLDADTHELIAVIDDPSPDSYETGAEQFAASVGAAIERISPSHFENECIVELRIPPEVRRAYMPLPGDKVIFTAKAGYYEQEVVGIYKFKRGRSYVICDEVGGEWLVRSMWQMKKYATNQYFE
jgi:hypothetical protein